VVAEDGLAEHVEDLVLRIVVVHRDLLQDDLPLGVEVIGVEARAEDHVGHHVEGLGDMTVEHPGVDGGRLLACSRVELRAPAVEELVDLERLVAVGPPEEHVLGEVGEAGLVVRLPHAARPDPEPERRGSDRGHRLGHDPDARVQGGQLVPLTDGGDYESDPER